MIRPGLCSVTFRALAVEDVIARAVEAGLECIEWGGDGHVPPGDLAEAERVRALTEQAGLAVASYGAYLGFADGERADEIDRELIDAIIATARALGAPRIRVWAGRTPSEATDPALREEIVRRIRLFADAAGLAGIDVGLEHHGGTLTDEIGSTLRLLDEIDRSHVLSYWQPHQDMPAPEALATLRALLPRVSTIHVFSWWPGSERHLLAALPEREGLWREAFAILREEGSDHDALIEFVPADDPALLAGEAATLRAWIAGAPTPAPGSPAPTPIPAPEEAAR
ncbi:sugar phosphate isomerase/epimerase family protein [Brachybacterium sp. DNPG3]